MASETFDIGVPIGQIYNAAVAAGLTSRSTRTVVEEVLSAPRFQALRDQLKPTDSLTKIVTKINKLHAECRKRTNIGGRQMRKYKDSIAAASFRIAVHHQPPPVPDHPLPDQPPPDQPLPDQPPPDQPLPDQPPPDQPQHDQPTPAQHQSASEDVVVTLRRRVLRLQAQAKRHRELLWRYIMQKLGEMVQKCLNYGEFFLAKRNSLTCIRPTKIYCRGLLMEVVECARLCNALRLSYKSRSLFSYCCFINITLVDLYRIFK
jgi:hypothetical protein